MYGKGRRIKDTGELQILENTPPPPPGGGILANVIGERDMKGEEKKGKCEKKGEDRRGY
jgi:hypothetical protein